MKHHGLENVNSYKVCMVNVQDLWCLNKITLAVYSESSVPSTVCCLCQSFLIIFFLFLFSTLLIQTITNFIMRMESKLRKKVGERKTNSGRPLDNQAWHTNDWL